MVRPDAKILILKDTVVMALSLDILHLEATEQHCGRLAELYHLTKKIIRLLRRGKPVQVVANEVGYRISNAQSRVFMDQVGLSSRKWKR